MKKFPTLLSEGHIGSLIIKNRVIMPAMGTLLAGPAGEMTDHMIAYYSERAAGGCGLIIIEVACIEHELGRANATQLRIDDDRFIPGFSRLAGSVQKYGTKIFVQLHHAGNQSNSTITGGKQIVAPSPVINSAVGEQPRELSTSEVKELVEKFVSAALRAQQAGLDGVELHGAHGYLIDEFLSPHTNHRTDEYGGTSENRMRFATEIVRGIKTRCGTHFPVIVRISADEYTSYGITLDDGKQIAVALQEAGADAINVSSGTYESMQTIIEPITYREGWRSYLAESIREVVKIPVITVGAIKRPHTAEQILEQRKADFIAIGRALLCDPEWVNKAETGKESQIVPCIGCLFCIDTIFSQKRIACAVNARTGRELEFGEFKHTGDNRTVAVIGAGPAGMEAARVLVKRGFKPVVYEKHPQAGGELVPGCRPPDKEPILWYKDALIENCKADGIKIKTGVTATPEMIKKDKPYAVVVAIGGKNIIPSDIDGLDTGHVMAAIDVLRDPQKVKPGSRVVIVGGGMTGCETAELLARKEVQVTIVEMVKELAKGENSIARSSELERLLKIPNVEILTGFKLTAIRNRELELQSTDQKENKNIYADIVIMALGLEPHYQKALQFKRAFEKTFVVGDALRPQNVAFAVRTGFDTGWCLE